MNPIISIGLLSFSLLSAYFLSLTSLTYFLPQLIALFTIILLIFHFQNKPRIYLASFIVNLIIFGTHGLSSPFLSLQFFLLTVIAFTFPPLISSNFSLITVLLLSQTLNSINSLFTLLSFLLITPLAYFVSLQTKTLRRQSVVIAADETDFLMWLNLKFKNSMTAIIDTCSLLRSTPLSYTQKQSLKKIKDLSKSLLHSSEQLTSEISSKSNDEEI